VTLMELLSFLRARASDSESVLRCGLATGSGRDELAPPVSPLRHWQWDSEAAPPRLRRPPAWSCPGPGSARVSGTQWHAKTVPVASASGLTRAAGDLRWNGPVTAPRLPGRVAGRRSQPESPAGGSESLTRSVPQAACHWQRQCPESAARRGPWIGAFEVHFTNMRANARRS
jgi:hypothetical protein